ncbi:DUF7529 family protein [Halegenticoccus tardaugens]|uniref:DUF7529 family protein n=1 Tax=Halegenticoccus tardaugens TaxID=2071624 RepID=UPI00100AAF13|nr:hypothetical protein [Halegenticoccus tardaugens]
MDAHPLDGVLGVWEGVVEETEATAAALREEGWEAVELHPGDVTPLPSPLGGDADVVNGASGDAAGSRSTESADSTVEFGLDALVPGSEFEAVAALVEGTSFDEYEAYRAQEGGVVFLAVVMKAASAKRAVVLPLYYAVADARGMLDRAREAGRMRTVVRPLSDDRRVVFTQDDPEPLFPE